MLACLRKVVHKLYTNKSDVLESRAAFWSTKTRNQQQDWCWQSHLFCAAPRTHIKSIIVFIQGDGRVELARGKLTNKGSNMDLTRLESGMSFLQMKASRGRSFKRVQSTSCVKW